MPRTDSPTRPLLAAETLRIEIIARCSVRWYGTLAELTAEGLIPSGLKPRPARLATEWTDDTYAWQLQRAKPEGYRGRWSWSNDYWSLERDLKRLDWQQARHAARVYELEKELESLKSKDSAAALWHADGVWRARRNEPFRAFLRRLEVER
jgi:hypothetical protein